MPCSLKPAQGWQPSLGWAPPLPRMRVGSWGHFLPAIFSLCSWNLGPEKLAQFMPDSASSKLRTCSGFFRIANPGHHPLRVPFPIGRPGAAGGQALGPSSGLFG